MWQKFDERDGIANESKVRKSLFDKPLLTISLRNGSTHLVRLMCWVKTSGLAIEYYIHTFEMTSVDQSKRGAVERIITCHESKSLVS